MSLQPYGWSAVRCATVVPKLRGQQSSEKLPIEWQKGITMKFVGYESVVKTEAGKTGIGLEVRVAGMKKYHDLSVSQRESFKNEGFRYMMPKWEEVDGKWVCTRPCFFYKSYKTKKERDAQFSRMVKHLIKREEEPKEEPKAEEVKKPNFDKMTKAELKAYIAAHC